MTPIQFNVDILGELERILGVGFNLYVPDVVINELEGLAKKGSLKERKAATVGLGLAKKMQIVKVGGDEPDAAILSIIDRDTVVCTNDKLLKERVKEKGGKVIFLRQKKTLQLEGGDVGVS